MTRWLNDDEQVIWRSFLSVHRKLDQHLGPDLQDKHNLSLADYEILVRLSEADGRRLRMSELAELTMSSRSRLSHQIDRMVEASMVTREDCPDDRRGLFAVLTDHGFAVLEQAAPDHVEGVRRYFFDAFTPAEIATLGSLMAKVDNRLTGPGI